MNARYAHTNLVARDWRALARFYEELFGCVPVPPECDFGAPDLDAGTGVPGAHDRRTPAAAGLRRRRTNAHVHRQGITLKAAIRSLKPGGRLAVIYVAMGGVPRPPDECMRAVKPQ